MKKLSLILITFFCIIQLNAEECIPMNRVNACKGLKEGDRCNLKYPKKTGFFGGTCQYSIPNQDVICGTGGPIIALYCKKPE